MSTIPTLSISASSGQVGVTNFVFNSGITDPSYKIVWYFGDGGSVKAASAQHIYYSPGNYTVTMMAYPKVGSVTIIKKTLSVFLNLNNSIKFDFIPPPTLAGHYNRYPFRVSITSPDVLDHYVNLGCQFSRSDSPPDTPNKWSFLKPQWKFFDTNGNLIQKIKTTDTVIKFTDQFGGTHTAGVTGYADFYFTDDIYNSDLAVSGQPYSTIIATLDTLDSKDFTLQSDALNQLPGFANSLVVATCPHIFLWRTPDYLKVSENGIRPFSNPRWSYSNIPVMINANVSQPFPDPFPDGNGVRVINPNSFFVHNFPLNNLDTPSLTVQITGYDVAFDPSPSMEWTDSSNYKTPGYYKGMFNFPNLSATNIRIDANLTFGIPVKYSNYISPLLWISVPSSSNLYITRRENFKELNLISNLDPVYIKNINIPQSLSNNDYFIAANLVPDYHAWVSDANLKKIYHVSSFGTILSTVDIPSLIHNSLNVTLSGDLASPSGLIMDSNKNVWFSLKNSLSTIKLDPYGNFILATHPFVSGGSFSRTDSPIYMETDIYDNVYVSYQSSSNGYIIKYSQDGSIFQSVRNIYSSRLKPRQVISTSSGEAWYCTYDASSQTYQIDKKSLDNNLLYYSLSSGESAPISFGPYSNVNHLTLDKDQNLWFTYNQRSLGKISNTTLSLTSVELIDSYSSPTPSSSDEFGGLTSDFTGRIYALNSMEGRIYTVDCQTLSIVDTFFVKKSSKAIGDWNGFKWINKYRNGPEFFNEETYHTISGSSNYLNFYPDNTTDYGVFKLNENYNLAQSVKDHAFTPKLMESTFLFDKFFPSLFGSSPLKPDDLGVDIYQKIANFTLNHNDIDTCNLDQLYSNAQMVDLVTDDFRLKYPPNIQRLINLASINQSRLWGGQDLGGLEFNSKNQNGFFNKGSLISSFNYRVSAGVPVVLKDKTTYNPHRLIYTGPINGYKFYYLDTLADYLGLPQAWRSQYEFYSYIPSLSSGDYLDGIIDWNNPQTTIKFNNPTPNYWSGNEGVLETLFGYELYKGLNLLND